jgi:hypothetical protein
LEMKQNLGSCLNRIWWAILPPVSSLTTIMSTPSATSFFRVDASTSYELQSSRKKPNDHSTNMGYIYWN